ncbi:MAG TPA: AAA family ATPase, partial [Vicinamibacterales bacterium]|nr:AAA family ATPase [Vicinamibacterales bacterium]
MTDLAGYVLETLRDDGELALYRGRPRWDPGGAAPLLVLAPVAPAPKPATVERLEHEYALAHELDPDWAAQPLALIRHEQRLMLVLRDPGGEPIDRVLSRSRDLTTILQASIGLTDALGQVHRRGLIHKDIKPANVLLDEAGHVWLTGFGIASRLPRERQDPGPPGIIAGTLAYMAPEQTGRMNRSIDARSDLYALGVTLYELLTKSLPFAADDPLEWVHCHMARQPTPPFERAPDIPPPLSAIVMKLLAKTAEERYQTAAGLAADLRRCLIEWESTGRIDPFSPGAHDASDRLLIPETLYGRKRQIDGLLAAFEQVVADGTPAMALISGHAGIGKSSVVHELHKALVPRRGLFAAGKFDQHKRDNPHATIARACHTLIRQILGSSDAELRRWRDDLRRALEPNGQVIVNLIPALEFVIGPQPPVPDLPAPDGQHRFQAVFQRFLAVFARPEHPLALFLDDLQWLDAATLALIERLFTGPGVGSLLLVGAYRDNEVGPSHPLVRTLAAVRTAGVKVHEVVLAPLRTADLTHLVADALHCGVARAAPLARLVGFKTGGNPFFANQFLTSLAEEGLIAFDPDATAWTWDLARIRARHVTDNVVDLLIGKLARLSADTQDALQQLACL